MQGSLRIGLAGGVCVLSVLACGRSTARQPAAPSPMPIQAATRPAEAGEGGWSSSETDLGLLMAYAEDIQPMLTEAGAILERDGEILKAVEAGDEAALCDGRLKADNMAMALIVERVQAVHPPPEAVEIHRLMVQAGRAWTQALDSVEDYCRTGNALHKIPAIAKSWEAAAALRDASDRFWALLLASGLEVWAQR
jgi:hypothetical protein